MALKSNIISRILNEYQNGIDTRIVLDISANNSDGVVYYRLGTNYVSSVNSDPYGLVVNLQNIPTGIKTMIADFKLITSDGIIVNSNKLNPYLYQRMLNSNMFHLGIAKDINNTSIPFSSISSGMFRIEIGWGGNQI